MCTASMYAGVFHVSVAAWLGNCTTIFFRIYNIKLLIKSVGELCSALRCKWALLHWELFCWCALMPTWFLCSGDQCDIAAVK